LAQGSIAAVGALTATARVDFSAFGQVVAVGSMAANLYRIGEEWTDQPAQANTWTSVVVGPGTWTNVVIGSGTWTKQSVGPNTWNQTTIGHGTWQRVA
jgi:hypothetical protein